MVQNLLITFLYIQSKERARFLLRFVSLCDTVEDVVKREYESPEELGIAIEALKDFAGRVKQLVVSNGNNKFVNETNDVRWLKTLEDKIKEWIKSLEAAEYGTHKTKLLLSIYDSLRAVRKQIEKILPKLEK